MTISTADCIEQLSESITSMDNALNSGLCRGFVKQDFEKWLPINKAIRAKLLAADEREELLQKLLKIAHCYQEKLGISMQDALDGEHFKKFDAKEKAADEMAKAIELQPRGISCKCGRCLVCKYSEPLHKALTNYRNAGGK